MNMLQGLAVRALMLFATLGTSAEALANCTGTTSTSPFTPAVVVINKNTPVGQVVSSATVTLAVTCTAANAGPSGWLMNYTPSQPIQSGQMVLNAYGTSIPGLGYQMFGTDGQIVKPTTYGTNGGDNFGPGGMGPVSAAAAASTTTYQFKLTLVRTSTALTSGTFTSSLVSFGYQQAKPGSAHPYDGYCTGIGDCSTQLGVEVTSPVTFQFVSPTCTVTAGTANQTIPLPPASTRDFAAVGATANPTGFNISLVDCPLQTGVSMRLDGTTQAPTVLANTGTAQGVGIQVARNGTPVTFGQATSIGNVGNSTTMDIPMVASYYSTGAMVGGTVAAVSTVTMSYQ